MEAWYKMMTFRRHITRLSDSNPLNLVERNLVLSPVIKLGCPRRFVVRDLLRDFEFAAVLQIRRNAGRAKSVIANPRLVAATFGIVTTVVGLYASSKVALRNRILTFITVPLDYW
jgi:hypothetical protein